MHDPTETPGPWEDAFVAEVRAARLRCSPQWILTWTLWVPGEDSRGGAEGRDPFDSSGAFSSPRG